MQKKVLRILGITRKKKKNENIQYEPHLKTCNRLDLDGWGNFLIDTVNVNVRPKIKVNIFAQSGSTTKKRSLFTFINQKRYAALIMLTKIIIITLVIW